MDQPTQVTSSTMPLYSSFDRFYNFVSPGSDSRSLNRLNHAMVSGFCTVALGFTSFPLKTFLTAISTFFPLIVTGMSGTAITNLGTCRGDSPFRTAFLTCERNSVVKEMPGFMTRNKNTCSSGSFGLRRPTHRLLLMYSVNG